MSIHRPVPVIIACLAALAFSAPLRTTQTPPVPVQDTPPPPQNPATQGEMKTIVIDPGHGGDDVGVRGVGGTKEKDLVLAFARKLKAEIEGRLMMHVLFTREGDDSVPIDSRAVFANRAKADLFISLHANASVRPTLRGTEVMALGTDDLTAAPPAHGKGGRQAAPPPPPVVPLVTGGMRILQPVPWDVAQIPFIDQSTTFSATLVKRLIERAIPSNMPFTATAPLRVLVGANMPAVLIELGFLSNADDETALNGTDVPNAIIAALVDTINDVRFGFPPPPPKIGR